MRLMGIWGSVSEVVVEIEGQQALMRKVTGIDRN